MGEREGEILRAACLTLKDMADVLDVPHTTVRNWAAGRIELPSASASALADFLDRRSGELTELAAELRKAAGA